MASSISIMDNQRLTTHIIELNLSDFSSIAWSYSAKINNVCVKL